MITGAEVVEVLKKSKNVIETLIKTRDFIKHQEILKSLLGDIVSSYTMTLQLQKEHSALIAAKDNLEKEAVRLKAWGTERQNYEINEVAPQVFAYVSKKAMQDGGPVEWFCRYCYDNGEKGGFQLLQESAAKKTYQCERCGKQIHIPSPRKPVKNVSPLGWT